MTKIERKYLVTLTNIPLKDIFIQINKKLNNFIETLQFKERFFNSCRTEYKT